MIGIIQLLFFISFFFFHIFIISIGKISNIYFSFSFWFQFEFEIIFSTKFLKFILYFTVPIS